jgi:hypothetical protein
MACLSIVLCTLLLFSIPPSYSAGQSGGKNIIAQHVYAIPKAGSSQFSVNLSLPVTSGDLLVVGVVFGSVDTGSVTDSLSNSFSGQQQNRSMVCYPCASNLGTGIWWATSRSSGNDTVIVRSLNSTELVEVFEIAGANASTIGLGSGGGWSRTPGLDGISAGGVVHDGTAFVLVIGGSADGNQSGVMCYPYGPIDNIPAQSPGFTIEPYCGTASPFTGGLIFGEYGIGNNTGRYVCQPYGNGSSCTATGTAFVADLGVNPPLAGYALGQTFYVDPTPSVPTQTTTTTAIPEQTSSNNSPLTTSTQPTTSTSTLTSTGSVSEQSTSSSSTESGGTGVVAVYTPYIVAAVAALAVAVGVSAVLLRRQSASH